MMHEKRQTTTRGLARAVQGSLAALGAACLVLVAAPVCAHVTIDPATATRGGYVALSLRVPDESETASTTKVQVYLPGDHPIASVSVRPHPGWTAKVVTTKLAAPLSTDDGQVTEAVSRVTWTANSRADALKPGEYDDFDLALGPLPDVSSLTFKTLQTYSDGTVARWIDEPAPAGQPEPEHPAPVLKLVATGSSDPAGSTSDDAGSGDGGGIATAALALSIVAVVLAAGSLGSTLLRRRTR